MLIPKTILSCYLSSVALIAFSQNNMDTAIVPAKLSRAGPSPGIENQKQFQVHIKKTDEAIVVDGDLKEDIWRTAEVAPIQWNWVPQDVGIPKRKVEMRTCYDEQFIYFSFTGFDSTHTHVTKTLKRDALVGASDVIGLVLDPNNAGVNGYIYGLSTANVQCEDVISSGGVIDVDWSWDNIWHSGVKKYADKWTMEFAIPFKTLRYPKDKKIWGLNFGQGDIENNQYSVWAKLPADKFFVNLGFTGSLIWDTVPPDPGKNISLIPYAKTSFTSSKEENSHGILKATVGFDAKLGLSSSLNLDLTVNPDFSQVEVDEQVTNLTRFSIFFPEKRTFFLENADLFSDYGSEEIKPFYSRTIGLDAAGNPIPIIAGARLTGNLDKKTRTGFMNMQSKKQDDFAAQNYTALAFNRRVLARSVLKGYFLNRQAFLSDKQKENNPAQRYARNAGLQFEFSDKRSLFRVWAGYHTSFKKSISGKNNYFQSGAGYFHRKLNSSVSYEAVGTNYFAEMGFVQRIYNYDAAKDTLYRLGFRQFTNPNKYTVYPKKGKINQHVFELNNIIVLTPGGSLNERKHELIYTINFKNTAFIELGTTAQQSNLLFPLKFVTDAGAAPLPPSKYRFEQFNFLYQTDERKLVYAEIGMIAGSFYNGNMFQQTTGIFLRKQPWGNLSLNFEYNKLRFPGNYGEAELYLVGSKIEIGFSTKIFWTTFIQYNTQLNNININSRFQWRFKPMSDIYLVYTDNYFSTPFLENRNRGVILKMNWWLNL